MNCFRYFGYTLVVFITAYPEELLSEEVPCIKKYFLNPVQNRALRNHVISAPAVTSEEACKIQCFIEVKCESYNFGPKEGGGHVCELSDSDSIRDPQDLNATEGYLYGETQNPCENAQCPVNARCYSDFEHETYACVCLPGFAGDNCEPWPQDVPQASQGAQAHDTKVFCKAGWTKYKGFCYAVSVEVATFSQANSACISEGAGLVSIEDFDELLFLDTILEKGEKVFVGMTDIAVEGRWVWMDGSVPTLDPLWHGNHPDGGLQENCGEYVQDHGFHDIKCDETRIYVCKYTL